MYLVLSTMYYIPCNYLVRVQGTDVHSTLYVPCTMYFVEIHAYLVQGRATRYNVLASYFCVHHSVFLFTKERRMDLSILRLHLYCSCVPALACLCTQVPALAPLRPTLHLCGKGGKGACVLDCLPVPALCCFFPPSLIKLRSEHFARL